MWPWLWLYLSACFVRSLKFWLVFATETVMKMLVVTQYGMYFGTAYLRLEQVGTSPCSCLLHLLWGHLPYSFLPDRFIERHFLMSSLTLVWLVINAVSCVDLLNQIGHPAYRWLMHWYCVLKIMVSNCYRVSVLTSLVSQFPGIIDMFLELEFIQNATRIILQYQGEDTCSCTSLLEQSLKSSY